MPRFMAAMIFLLAATLPVTTMAAERVGLVIGIDKYEHLFELKNAARDAAAMRDKLSKLGFEVKIVTDTNRSQLEEAIAALKADAQGAEMAIVYFAGHSVQIGGSNFVIPTDGVLEAAGDLPAATIGLHRFTEAAAGAGTTIILHDAARNNPFPGDEIPELEKGSGKESGNVVLMFATASGEVAADGQDNDHSPFVTALLKHLGTPGEEIQTTAANVRMEVFKATDGEQMPWMYMSGTDSPVIVAE